MKRISVLALLLIAVFLVVGACGTADETAETADVVRTEAPGSAGQDVTEETATLTSTQEPSEPSPDPTSTREVASGPTAPEVEGIHAWINSQPLMISELKGKVVLVDFWTYTCVNCIRTFPFLKTWHAKYADDGLVILGVHAPEFEFERKLENVQQAVEENGIGWPVALDNDYTTWRAYKNRFWPAKYLIDRDGVIRYTHFGEGAYAETEEEIRKLLEEAGANLEFDNVLPEDQALDPTYQQNPSSSPTRELYAGHERNYNDILFGSGGYIGNRAYYQDFGTPLFYEDLDEHADNLIYLQGAWHNGPESLKHARETSDYEDYIYLKYNAKSVNLVISPEENAEPFKVLVTLDGDFLDETYKGEDVVIEEDGRSFVYVEEPRLYSIVQGPKFDTHELKFSSNSPNFAIFAFTFGFYESGI